MLFIGTETPLGASDVWQSDTESYPGYPVPTNLQKAIVGTVYSDQGGNLYVDQSPDGINWDVVSSPIAVTGGTGELINVTINGFYVRLRYINGDVAQTELRIACVLNDSGPDEPV